MSKARDLGASLLSQKQARDDKFRKRQRSYEKRLAWASLAVPAATKAISTVLTDKANTWLSNEDSCSAVVQFLYSIIEPLNDSPSIACSGPPNVTVVALPEYAILYEPDTTPCEPLISKSLLDS